MKKFKEENRTFYNAKYAMKSITKQTKSHKYYNVVTLFAWYLYSDILEGEVRWNLMPIMQKNLAL